jgi:hypothetical protein
MQHMKKDKGKTVKRCTGLTRKGKFARKKRAAGEK